MRRVVTGHDKNGRSCFVMDGHATNVKEMESMPGLALTDLWETTDAPASNEGNADAVTRPVLWNRPEKAPFFALSSFRRTRNGATAPTRQRLLNRSAPHTQKTARMPIR